MLRLDSKFYGICNLTFFSTNDAVTVYKEAKEFDLVGKGYIWISNQQAITGDALSNAPQGKSLPTAHLLYLTLV